jgi:hypothetical protein
MGFALLLYLSQTETPPTLQQYDQRCGGSLLALEALFMLT